MVTNLNLAGIDDQVAILLCQAARFEDSPLDINVLDLKLIASRSAQETAHDSVSGSIERDEDGLGLSLTAIDSEYIDKLTVFPSKGEDISVYDPTVDGELVLLCGAD